ncbi:acyltransferase family protein [Subtercola endophyticus]|uniref:acyltransferase family protein n=1 Tax=Subtercola endophyticus TaxID=2895559 RepID=UPI001E504E62|nr:acyltransferase family protein [Subtercola endophyticus]UFS57864.1 acyltransferase family protein [Subtercola endophyticus]
MRNAGIDAVRILGIVAVIIGHVWTDNVIVRDVIYTWHVPVFFFLTGYFWTKNRSIKTEVSKRSRSLAMPYVTWLILISVAYIPWLLAQGLLNVHSLADIVLGGSHLGRPFSAFWFVSALFIVAFVYRLIERLPNWCAWVIALALLALAYIEPHLVAAVPLSGGVAVSALIFVLLGTAFRKSRTQFSRPTVTAVALLAASAALIASGVSRPLDMKQANFGTPVLSVLVAVAISIALVLLGETWIPKLGSRVSQVIISLAGVGMMVVLTHAIVLWVLGTPPSGSVIALILALVVPWTVALIVVRTPLAPWLVGTPSTRKRLTIVEHS